MSGAVAEAQAIVSLCLQVPRDLLQDWAIIQAEGPLTGVELPPGLPPAMVQTFMLQARQPNGSPAAYEHMAVQQACSQLLSNVWQASCSMVYCPLHCICCLGLQEPTQHHCAECVLPELEG